MYFPAIAPVVDPSAAPKGPGKSASPKTPVAAGNTIVAPISIRSFAICLPTPLSLISRLNPRLVTPETILVPATPSWTAFLPALPIAVTPNVSLSSAGDLNLRSNTVPLIEPSLPPSITSTISSFGKTAKR